MSPFYFLLFPSSYNPIYSKSADNIPEEHVQHKVEPIEFGAILSRLAWSPGEEELKWETQGKYIRNRRNDIGAPEYTGDVEQGKSADDFLNGWFENGLHELTISRAINVESNEAWPGNMLRMIFQTFYAELVPRRAKRTAGTP